MATIEVDPAFLEACRARARAAARHRANVRMARALARAYTLDELAGQRPHTIHMALVDGKPRVVGREW